METRHDLLRRCKELRVAHATDRNRLVVAVAGVDRFARVRGAIGYKLAEQLVDGLGDRMQSALNGEVARLAPDCIGAVFFIPDDDEACHLELTKLHGLLELPIDVQGHRMHVGVRIGFAVWDDAAASSSDILNQAEMALDQARETTRSIQQFSTEKYGDPMGRLTLLDELRDGLRRDELHLLYQPQVRTRTGEVVSAEALMRWNHPTRGPVPPTHFIPTAEETGQIRELTEWAIARALRDVKTLKAAGHNLRIGVNIASRLLCDPAFADTSLEILGGDSDLITFEITESAEIQDWPLAMATLRTFADAGIRISIDDYGSGMSSLAYLQQLPAHELKIDRQFVTQLVNSNRDPLLVRSTIELGHALEFEVVAEGIQDAETLALLTMMGCDIVQGYFIGMPQTLDELITYLESDEAREKTTPPLLDSLFWAQG